MKPLHQLLTDEAAATLTEYSLLVGLIAVTAVLVVGTFGGQLAGMFASFAKAFSNA